MFTTVIKDVMKNTKMQKIADGGPQLTTIERKAIQMAETLKKYPRTNRK